MPTDEADVREMLRPLVQSLTGSDKDRRQDNVRRLVTVCPLSVLCRLTGRLVELLGSRKEAVRRQAVASPSKSKSPAPLVLTLSLGMGRRPGMQRALAETLTVIAARLQQDQVLTVVYDAITAA